MSVPAGTPVILYDSAGMPVGSFQNVTLYRPTAASVMINGTAYASAVPIASGALSGGAAELGVYLFEKASLSTKGQLIKRSTAIGPAGDKKLLLDDPTLNATIQCAAQGTPSLFPGDCFEAMIGYKASSTAGAPVSIPLSRWFIMTGGINFDASDPTKFTITFELDRQNSATTLIEF